MKQDYFLLFISIFTSPFPALLVKKIDLTADIIVWWRLFISGTCIGLYLITTKKWKVHPKKIPWLVISGLFFGINGWAFFAAVKVSTISTAVISLYTFPLISVILEPIYTKTKIQLHQLIGGAGIIFGVYFLVPEFSLENNTTKGVFYGVLSAFCLSARNIITRKNLSELNTLTLFHYQILFALVPVSFLISRNLKKSFIPSNEDWGLLILLGTIFTIATRGLFLYLLKHFTASTLSILTSLEVVWSPLLAFLLLGEIPKTSFYLGTIIITSITFYEMHIQKQKKTERFK